MILQMNRPPGLSFFLLIVVAAGVFALYYFIQPSLTYSECSLCDGNQYLRLYRQFRGEGAQPVQFPYYSRILVPALAALLPFGDPLAGFRCVNFIFCLLTIGGLYLLWRKLAIPGPLMALGFAWLLFHWIGMVRLNAQDPLTVDVPAYFIHTLFLLIFLGRRFSWLWLLAPVAVFQKESFNAYLLGALACMVFDDSRNKKVIVHLAGPVMLSLLLKWVYTLWFPPLTTNDKTALETIITNAASFIIHPFTLVRWCIAMFFAYGGFIVLAALNMRQRQPNERGQRFFLGMTIISLALSLTGGGDFTRIAFLGFPFVMTFLLLQM